MYLQITSDIQYVPFCYTSISSSYIIWLQQLCQATEPSMTCCFHSNCSAAQLVWGNEVSIWFGSGFNHSHSQSVGYYVLKMAAVPGIDSQICCRCSQFAYLFEPMCLWFALMQIREVWGDSLVLSPCVSLPAVGLVGLQSRYKSLCTSPIALFWCCHQTKVALDLN